MGVKRFMSRNSLLNNMIKKFIEKNIMNLLENEQSTIFMSIYSRYLTELN